MGRGFPSMTALLGLLAVAGYQNRDKIAEMLGGLTQRTKPAAGTSPGTASPGVLDGLLGSLGGASASSVLGGGLRELVDRFRQSGQGEAVDSWVGKGENRKLNQQELEQAIGADVLATLTRQTGLSRDELLARLCRELPDAVDRYTPDGRIPSDSDVPRS